MCKEKTLPDGFKLKRIHLHDGNSTERQRKGFKYVTITQITDPKGIIVAGGIAKCAHHDNPSRALGRTIADGRALDNFYSQL